MSWTADGQEKVARVLLGSWPTTVAGWGRDGIANYVGELEARGLTAEGAVVALRSCEAEFPPSAATAAKIARQDASAPTFDEAWKVIMRALTAPGYAEARRQQIAETGSTFVSDEDDRALEHRARQDAIADAHPLVRRFVDVLGWGKLADATEGDYAGPRQHELRERWAEMAHAVEGREIAALASGSGREGLHRLDPVGALGRKELAP